MDLEQFVQNSRPFLTWLLEWHAGLPTITWDEILQDVDGDPGRIAVMAVDVTRGFCSEGPLASERVGRIVEPISRLFQSRLRGWRSTLSFAPGHPHRGCRRIRQLSPPTALRGSNEPQTVDELRRCPLPALSPSLKRTPSARTSIPAWALGWTHDPQVTTVIVTGDCTDLCVYQLAMYLRLRANARNLRQMRVIVPMDSIDTFDLPVEEARRIGAMPHDADLLHLVFAHAMASNGVEMVKQVA
jgi:nicotinamidase-related amidase